VKRGAPFAFAERLSSGASRSRCSAADARPFGLDSMMASSIRLSSSLEPPGITDNDSGMAPRGFADDDLERALRQARSTDRNLPRVVARAFWREIAAFWREIADIMHPQLCEEFLHVSE